MSMDEFPEEEGLDSEVREPREPLPPEPERTHLDPGQEDPDLDEDRDTRGNVPVEGL